MGGNEPVIKLDLTTLLVLTVGINVLIGVFMGALYRLRREQLCFCFWSLSCLVFAAGCLAAGAVAFLPWSWLTVVIAYTLLVLGPLFVLCGMLQFVEGRAASRSLRRLFFGLLVFVPLLAIYRDSPQIPRLMTAAYTAVIFIAAFRLTRRIQPASALPVRALQLFFLTHGALMAVEVVTVFHAWWHRMPLANSPVLEAILVSHILLANCTALTFPLLAFFRSEHKLRILAESDALTGLCNRRAFYSRGTHAFREAVQAGAPFTVLMIDLDHFKQINDRWGHGVGDDVLRFMARLLREELREDDIVGRIGGEEFAVALPGTTEEQARCISERLRERIFQRGRVIAGEPVNLSASIGGVHREEHHTSFNDMLMQADSALYSAKGQGRNTVFFAMARALEA